MVCLRSVFFSWSFLWIQVSLFVTTKALETTLPPPSLKITGPPAPVPQGATATLTCQSVGDPQSVVDGWLKNGIEIQSGGRFRERQSSHYQLLQIWNVRKEDQGTYQCKAIQGTQNLTASVRVRVIVPPVLHNVTNSTTAVTGSDLTLHCFGTNLLFIRWRLNNSYIDYLPRYKVIGMGSQLVIPNVTKADSGQFTCEAYNQKFQTLSTIVVTIQYAPEIVFQPKDTVMAIGHFVAFQCVSDAIPTAAAQWKHNGQLVVEDDHVHVDPVTSRLEIRKVLKDDQGGYQCVLTNTLGTVSSRFAELEVLDIAFEAPLETAIPVVYGQSVRLTCSVPSHLQTAGTIQWTLNGAVIDSAAGNQTSTGQLELHLVTYETEENHYVCLHHNPSESTVYMQDFQLAVKQPPEAVSSIQVVTVNQDGREGTIRISWEYGNMSDSIDTVMSYVVKVTSVESNEIIRSIEVSAEVNSTVIDRLDVNGSYYLHIETITPQLVYPSKHIHFRVQANSERHASQTAPPPPTNPEGTFIIIGGDNERHGNEEQEDEDSHLGAGAIAGIVSAVVVVMVIVSLAVVYTVWKYKWQGSWPATSDHLQIY